MAKRIKNAGILTCGEKSSRGSRKCKKLQKYITTLSKSMYTRTKFLCGNKKDRRVTTRKPHSK